MPSALSPNHGERRAGARVRLIVLHYTAMASASEARARLCDPTAEVSAHYLISEAGAVDALVPEDRRAWHAGAGSWGRSTDVNSASIGIELANPGDQPFSNKQMITLENLLGCMMARHAIAPQNVIAHSDMAPLRKRDPGPRFDWRRLALGGLSVWPQAQATTADFAASAQRFGYPDAPPDALLAAFRLRFRPWAQGPLDATDRALAYDLAQRFPVDDAPDKA